jgi:hypothetical protein
MGTVRLSCPPPLVVLRKPDGRLRVCVDHTRLNKYVRRPTHPVRTPKDAVSQIDSDTVYFSCFDATNGYFQIPTTKQANTSRSL